MRLTTRSFVLQGVAGPKWVGALQINGSYAVGQTLQNMTDDEHT